jgi:carboxypeptidase Q
MERSTPSAVTALALLGLSVTCLGDDTQLLLGATEVRDRALAENRAYETVASLTSEVGPRLAGSDGDRAAVAWAITRLKALGFDRVAPEDVSVPRWERGTAIARIVAPFPQTLATVALGGSIGTPATGIEAPVIRVEDLAELKTLNRAQVEGHIVYFAGRMQRTRDGSGYGKSVAKRYGGPVAAAALGAVAVVIRSVGTSNARLAHTGATTYIPGKPRIPGFAISNPDADLLEYQLATGRSVRLVLTSTARSLPSVRSANVVADMTGQDPAEGLIVLAAHLDSWDLGTGAIDDGAGVAIVTEAARQVRLAGQPRRTIRVVLYANEERAVSGANAYLRAHIKELPEHVVATEADLGAGRVWRLSARVPDEHWLRVQNWMPVFEPLGIEMGNNAARGGADIAILGRNGVPFVSLSHDASNYFDYHHTASDTLDKINPDDLSQAVAAYSALAYILANSEADLGRVPTAEKTQRP